MVPMTSPLLKGELASYLVVRVLGIVGTNTNIVFLDERSFGIHLRSFLHHSCEFSETRQKDKMYSSQSGKEGGEGSLLLRRL